MRACVCACVCVCARAHIHVRSACVHVYEQLFSKTVYLREIHVIMYFQFSSNDYNAKTAILLSNYILVPTQVPTAPRLQNSPSQRRPFQSPQGNRQIPLYGYSTRALFLQVQDSSADLAITVSSKSGQKNKSGYPSQAFNKRTFQFLGTWKNPVRSPYPIVSLSELTRFNLLVPLLPQQTSKHSLRRLYYTQAVTFLLTTDKILYFSIISSEAISFGYPTHTASL